MDATASYGYNTPPVAEEANYKYNVSTIAETSYHAEMTNSTPAQHKNDVQASYKDGDLSCQTATDNVIMLRPAKKSQRGKKLSSPDTSIANNCTKIHEKYYGVDKSSIT